MITNAFIGWTKAPTDAEVAAALGEAKQIWDLLAVDLAQELGLRDREWKSACKKYGWSLRLKRGKRNILHLAPCENCFHVAIILGERAVAAARASRLSRAATKLLDEAPRYPEGTGIYFDVSSARDLPLIRKLARIKLES